MLLKHDPQLKRVITVTTRMPRKGEIHGKDYFFLKLNKFIRMRDAGAFLEYALVHGGYYGTPRKEVSAILKQGKDPILVIDVQGGLNIKKLIPRALLIFCVPPTMRSLEIRLKKRGLDSSGTIRDRLRNARNEMKVSSRYDHVVVNRQLPLAVKEILRIIARERQKKHTRITL